VKKIRIIVTGSKGMLAQDLIPLLSKYEVYAFDRAALNVTNKKQVEEAIFQLRPHYVMNCAGFTNVDAAEINPDCYTANAIAVHHIVRACDKVKARLYHFSTDYVFDGASAKFYGETSGRNPINHYGRSKMLGEVALESSEGNHALVRIQWLFGKSGTNFVKKILELASDGRENINVVCDQFGRPTSTPLLSKAILYLLNERYSGKVHVGASNYCNWYDFAAEIIKKAKKNVAVVPCSSDLYPRPASRPKFGVLDVSLAQQMDVPMYSWQEHLSDYLES